MSLTYHNAMPLSQRETYIFVFQTEMEIYLYKIVGTFHLRA